MKLTPAQKRLLSIAKGMADLGLPGARVPEGFERCFTVSDIATNGHQVRTLLALVQKGVIEPVGILHRHGTNEVILRIVQEVK